ncbi:MAG: type II secretion system F family protein [Actinobacteria bacterium]|nr:type II secretion system F family protein [Actinomycetota bacterium]
MSYVMYSFLFTAIALNLYLLLSSLVDRRMIVSQRLQEVKSIGVQDFDESALDAESLNLGRVQKSDFRLGFLNRYLDKKRRKLHQAGMTMRPEELTILSCALAVVAFILVVLFSRLLYIALIAAVIGFLAPDIYVNRVRDKRANALYHQLPESLTLIANGLRAGLSFVQAMSVAGNDLDSPIKDEFDKVTRDNTLGKSIEEALLDLSYRTNDENISLFVTAMIVQRQVGGNSAEILETIAETVRERVRMQGQVRTLTSQSKMSAIIIGLLPPGIAVVLAVLNPTYIGQLFNTPIGIILVVVSTFMTLAGIFIMLRMTKLEV